MLAVMPRSCQLYIPTIQQADQKRQPSVPLQAVWNIVRVLRTMPIVEQFAGWNCVIPIYNIPCTVSHIFTSYTCLFSTFQAQLPSINARKIAKHSDLQVFQRLMQSSSVGAHMYWFYLYHMFRVIDHCYSTFVSNFFPSRILRVWQTQPSSSRQEEPIYTIQASFVQNEKFRLVCFWN